MAAMLQEFLPPSVWLSLQLWSVDQLTSGIYTVGYMASVVRSYIQALLGPSPGKKGICFENCISGSYMDAVFELVAHKESEICLSYTFTKEGLLQLSGY